MYPRMRANVRSCHDPPVHPPHPPLKHLSNPPRLLLQLTLPGVLPGPIEIDDAHRPILPEEDVSGFDIAVEDSAIV